MNLLSLNINGFGKGDYKLGWINNMINSHKIAVVGIQETKRKTIVDMTVRRLWGSGDFDYVFVGSQGQGGGLLSCWNNNLFAKKNVISRNDCIIIQGNWFDIPDPVAIINIYASQDPCKREELWQFLSGILEAWRGVAVLLGDFNDVREEKEKRGSTVDARTTKKFNEFIINNNLTDVKIGGCEFTWIKGGGSKLSRLDRILVNSNFGDVWPNFEAKSDIRLFSDHKPLIFCQIKRNYGQIPFNFFNSWLEDDECDKIIREEWDAFAIQGQHLKIFIIMQKLKAIKKKLKKWAVEKNKARNEEKTKWACKLVEIDTRIERGNVPPEVITERVEVLLKIRSIDKVFQDDIAQKNKNKWCLDGDENSALYHKTVNKKKHVNNIKGIDIEGTWTIEPQRVKEHFKDYYEKIFRADPECDWSQDLLNHTRISEQEQKDLEKEVEEKELKDAIWGCGYNKSPGPDDFTIELFKKYWEMMKKELREAFNQFIKRPKLPKGQMLRL